MTSEEEVIYNKGYFKALWDISNWFLKNDDYDTQLNLNSKKKYKKHVFSFIEYLLKNSYIREEFVQTNGYSLILKVDKKTGKVEEITKR